MSKHRSRRREEYQGPQGPQGPQGQNMFNQNPLMQMLSNIDINQLTSLLGSLNTNGLNLNNLNLNDFKFKPTAGENRDLDDGDNTVKLLNALRPFLNPKRAQLIDKMIDMYMSGEYED